MPKCQGTPCSKQAQYLLLHETDEAVNCLTWLSTVIWWSNIESILDSINLGAYSQACPEVPESQVYNILKKNMKDGST